MKSVSGRADGCKDTNNKSEKTKSVIRNKIVKIIFSDGKAYLNMNIRLKMTEPFELKISFLNEIYER